MGIDMRLYLTDRAVLSSILEMDWNNLIFKMNDQSMRPLRPQKDSKMNREFDIDCEAEFLDLSEQFEGEGTVRDVLSANSGYETLLKLVEWASVGYWEAWEGRCFLYLENGLDRQIPNVEDMYSSLLWDDLRSALAVVGETEFSEKVCADWMQRRKDLGETLDEKIDPRIIPTLEAHDKNARLLHYAINQTQYAQILGRDHLEARQWGHGDWNLGSLLDS